MMTQTNSGTVRLALRIARRQPAFLWLLAILTVRIVMVIIASVGTPAWHLSASIAYLCVLAGCILQLPRAVSDDPSTLARPRLLLWLGATIAYLALDGFFPKLAGLAANALPLLPSPTYAIFFLLALPAKFICIPPLLCAIWAASGNRTTSLREFGRITRSSAASWVPAFLVIMTIWMSIGVYVAFRLTAGLAISNGTYLLLQSLDGVLRFFQILLAIAIFQMAHRDFNDRIRIFD